MKARIYRPSKTAMQSGRAKTLKWVLESVPASPKIRDPLMGWTGTTDMDREWQLTFETKEEAIAYAEQRGIDYEVETPQDTKVRPKSYAANFRWDRPAD
jgi:hypothetical protein